MSEDRTTFLNKKAAIASGLTEDEAEVIASRLQANTDAVARFEALEAEIATLKKAGKWLGAFLLANYSTNLLDWLTR